MGKRSLFLMLCFLGLNMFLYSQEMDLDKVIDNSAKEVTTFFKQKKFKNVDVTVAVVVSMSSDMTDTEKMKQYISNRFESEIKRAKNLKLVARDKESLELRQAEIDYQYSGNVSDKELIQIGNETGVQYIVGLSFTQVDKKNMLTMRTLEMKTNNVVVGTRTYDIADSDAVKQLLKETRQLKTLTDFLTEIEKFQNQKRELEDERTQEIVNKQGDISSDYQKKIADAQQKVYPENYSDKKINAEKQKAVEYLEKERDQKLDNAQKTIMAEYEPKIRTLDEKKESTIAAVIQKDFELKDDEQIFVSVGDFERNAEPQYFPLTFRSLDKDIKYELNGNKDQKIEIKQDDVKDYSRINDPKKAGNIRGRLVYKLQRIKGTDRFDVFVEKAELFDKSNDAVLHTVLVNDVVDQIPPVQTAQSKKTNANKAADNANKAIGSNNGAMGAKNKAVNADETNKTDNTVKTDEADKPDGSSNKSAADDTENATNVKAENPQRKNALMVADLATDLYYLEENENKSKNAGKSDAPDKKDVKSNKSSEDNKDVNNDATIFAEGLKATSIAQKDIPPVDALKQHKAMCNTLQFYFEADFL